MEGQLKSTQQQIIDLLMSTQRTGMDNLISYLIKERFFEAPASTKYHGCYTGGLAAHSLGVFNLLVDCCPPDIAISHGHGEKPLPITNDTLKIATLLHDVCKIGAYIGSEKPYRYNRANPKGHALLSLIRIKKFIELTELEDLMIRYHMGIYGLHEFYSESDWQTGEYPLRGDHSKDATMSKEESQKARYGKSLKNAWNHNPVVKLMYFCDEQETLHSKS